MHKDGKPISTVTKDDYPARKKKGAFKKKSGTAVAAAQHHDEPCREENSWPGQQDCQAVQGTPQGKQGKQVTESQERGKQRSVAVASTIDPINIWHISGVCGLVYL